MNRVGVLGLGRMGLPIAQSLSAFASTSVSPSAFQVTVFDVAADRRALARDAGLTVAASAGELTSGVEILLTILPGPTEVAEALLEHGLLELLPPAALWLDLTSNDPAVAQRIADRAAARGVLSVSAPMGGGPSAVASGGLTFFVGGSRRAVDRARPLLIALGGDVAITYVGENIGDGCTAKLLANLLWFGQVVAVTEALLLGVRLGVPLRVLRTTLAGSAGGSVFIDGHLNSLLAGDYLETFGIDRCVEELETLVRLAEREDVPFELSQLVLKLHREAWERFGALDGELLAARLLEERAGIQLRE
jgi:3-hydroxyisobutyrate dehydrogenase